MNREQKAAVIDEIAAEIQASQAIFAIDYRGISVAQADQLRASLRQADAVFRVVKNSLTERAAQQAGAEQLLELLQGPTALTFVHGDAAAAAKAVADFTRTTQLLAFKGGVMDGASLSSGDVAAISRLPSRDVLYGQLVGLIASPLAGLARTLNALIGGLAVGLGGVLAQKESDPAFAGPLSAATDQPGSADDASATDDLGSEPVADAGVEPAAEAGEEPATDAGEEPVAEEVAVADAGEEPVADEAAVADAGEEPVADGGEEPVAEEAAAADAGEEPAADAGEEPVAQAPAVEEGLAEEVAAEDPVEQEEPLKDAGDALAGATEIEAEAAPGAEDPATEIEAEAAPAADGETEGAAPEAPSGDDDKEDQ